MYEIIRHKSNPLSVKHFASKLEFQARGAGHNHGVLWLDIGKIEQKVDIRQLRSDYNPEKEHCLQDPEQVHEVNTFLTERGYKPDKKKRKDNVHKALRYLQRLEKIEEQTELQDDHQKDLKYLKKIFPLYGLNAILGKLQQNDEVNDSELKKVVTFVDAFCTVSLHPAIVGPVVAAIAQKVNQHHHTKTCRKYQTKCRFNIPKLPSYNTIIARPPKRNLSPEEKTYVEEKYDAIIKKVKAVLDEKETISTILEKYPKEEEKTVMDAKEGRVLRINAVLDKAGMTSKKDKEDYCQALSYSSSGYTVVMARDIDELMVNSYNPEITMAWDGNTDFQFCFDFYAIITYITEYFTKDDTGVVKILVDTMKASDSVDLKEQMKLLMNTWIKNRQMGEAEAVYRLTREFKFRDSDTKYVFVQTCPRSERSKTLKNVTDKPEYARFPKVSVENHTLGEYVEQYDINSKYERRDLENNPELDDISFSHMTKMYRTFWGKDEKCDENATDDEEEENADNARCTTEPGEEKAFDIADNNHEFAKLHADYKTNPVDFEIEEEISSNEKFKFVMMYPLKIGEGAPLPKLFKLKDPFPGEPPYMKLRTKPAVLRYHKYNAQRSPESYWYAEAVLYLPHKDEEDLQEKLREAKSCNPGAWELFVKKISHVKGQVMEYVEENEEARLMAAEMFINNNLTGEFMDPQGEQENDDDQLDKIVLQEEFQHLDPELAEPYTDDVFEKVFQPIHVLPLQELRVEARKLDFYQRKVLEIGVKHARSLVKARGGKNAPPQNPPLVMVDGAAGAGKSCTINILKLILKLIMQQPGDNPECPYVLLCAPTGTAAVNIKGQTLHTTFSFTWGDEHFSLSDKNRDTKRALFRNLKFVIIDEISMVKADQLYQLDLRLREIKMQPNKLFGGIALFVFGDIMQLKPVKGVYIWCQPRNIEYFHAFHVQSHWEHFDVISLVENHRQKSDAEYADILNRIRVGMLTNEDLQILQDRVRPEGHPDLTGNTVIASTHAVVNKHNKLCLEQIKSKLVEIEAINSHNNIPNFSPKVDKKKGTVGTTAYVQMLQVKQGCRVMMIDNIDVTDCLCNGSVGSVKGIVRDKNGVVQFLMVKFDNDDSGREMRRCHPRLEKSFPGCTPVKRQMVKYSTSARSKGSRANLATVQQFPLIVSFASTTHKMQGQTIVAPRKAAVDLRSVFGPGQAYVMLGRVQTQHQLHILGSLPDNKIYADKNALSQLETMRAKSLNKHPSVWEKNFAKMIKVYFHNVQSIRDKFEDIKLDSIPTFGDALIFAETWLEPNSNMEDQTLQLKDYRLHLNSAGRGKGLAIFYRANKFSITQSTKDENCQISKLESGNVTIISLYRSQMDTTLHEQLKAIIPSEGTCLIIGDFNICSKLQSNHGIFKTLRSLNFVLLVDEATHLKGGHLDQAWLRNSNQKHDIQLYSPYYTCKDHDALLFSLYDPTTEQGIQFLNGRGSLNSNKIILRKNKGLQF